MLLPVHSFEPDHMLRQHIPKLVMSGLHISSTLTGDMAWCPRGSMALPGQRAHWKPHDVFKLSHHFMATWNTGGSRCRHKPSDGITDSQEDA